MAILKVRGIGSLLALAMFAVCPQAGATVSLTEAQVRAALLFKFASFTQWPARAASGQPFVIGVLGADAVGDALRQMRVQLVNGQRVEIRQIERDQDPRECQILYVPANSDDWSRMHGYLKAAPVLTVGEHAQFVQMGGMVRLYTDAGRFQFTINVARSQQVHLRISSKLLALAQIVKEPT